VGPAPRLLSCAKFHCVIVSIRIEKPLTTGTGPVVNQPDG
jgi:hypothetical protein